MAMTKLIAEVCEVVSREYRRASEKFGCTNHSDHESYAVLLEEVEEAKSELESIYEHMSQFWQCVKSDSNFDDKFSCCQSIEKRAILCACEMIQVAGVARKASLTACKNEDTEDKGGDNSG